jgi:hypothetical protein
MNCSSNVAALSAARSLPADLEQQLIRRLLTTAAKRQHETAMSCMLESRSVQQHMDTPTLEVLLRLLAASHSKNMVWGLRSAWDHLRPAAEGLSSDVVLQLLQTAALHGRYVYAHLLLQLPVAQQFSNDTMMQLLQNAIDQGAGDSQAKAGHIRELFNMAAADQPAGRVVQLLHVMLRGGYSSFAEPWCWVPAVEQMSAGEVLQLLLEAFACDAADRIAPVLIYKAAGQISHDAMLKLLQAAVEQRKHGCMRQLLKLNLAQVPNMTLAEQLNADNLLLLLHAAAECGADDCMKALMQLPAAERLNSEQLAGVLKVCVEPSAAVTGSADCVEVLSSTQQVQQLSSNAVMPLLLAAVQHDNTDMTRHIRRLPGALQLSSTTVAQLLHVAVQRGSAGCTYQLCQLPGARKIDEAAVGELLQVQHGNADCIEKLRSLPAACKLSSESQSEFQQLLQGAADSGSAECDQHTSC